MPGADDWPRASEMDAHLEWPSADDGDGGGSDETAATTRGFFLGQLPEDEPDDAWADKAPDGGSVEVLIYPEGTTTAQMPSSSPSNQ